MSVNNAKNQTEIKDGDNNLKVNDMGAALTYNYDLKDLLFRCLMMLEKIEKHLYFMTEEDLSDDRELENRKK